MVVVEGWGWAQIEATGVVNNFREHTNWGYCGGNLNFGGKFKFCGVPENSIDRQIFLAGPIWMVPVDTHTHF